MKMLDSNRREILPPPRVRSQARDVLSGQRVFTRRDIPIIENAAWYIFLIHYPSFFRAKDSYSSLQISLRIHIDAQCSLSMQPFLCLHSAIDILDSYSRSTWSIGAARPY